MTPSAPTPGPRLRADRCPGLLRPHRAEDGWLVRLRIPGGRLRTEQLGALAKVSIRYGSGLAQLTSRGNIQLRGLADDCLADLVEDLGAAGFLPSDTHERVRNIVASPLTGISGGQSDLRGLIAQVDHEICATPELADLPGRFLIALDDGRGDLTDLKFDLGYQARSADAGAILLGTTGLGVPVAASEATGALITLARTFLQVRGDAWHVDELDHEQVLALCPGNELVTALRGTTEVPLGAIGTAASVGVPLALLDHDQLTALSGVSGSSGVVVTPWRGLVIPDAASRLPELAAIGLTISEDSAWARISACIGAPGCGKSMINTRDLATEIVADGLDQRVHLSGCERRCGAPAGPHVDLLAPRSLQLARAIISEKSTRVDEAK